MQEKQNLSVLFVEDDPIAMERMASLLERESLLVTRAADGMAGLDAFKSARPDLVITDIRMPRMNGIEMSREIRNLDPDIPIIITSAHDETPYFIDAIDIGIDHYILKPVDGRVLLRAIGKSGEKKALLEARIRAEKALRWANESLEQKVCERTSELENALRTVSAAQKEWQDTFDSIGDQIAIVGTDYQVLRWNRAFKELFGLEDSALVGRKCHDLFCDPSVPKSGVCPHSKTLGDAQIHTEEIRRTHDGKVFRVTTFPYRSPSGELVGSIHVSRDITEMKDRALSMIMNERLAVLGQMVAGLAHELKNPLATMSGCSEMLVEKINAPELNRERMSALISILSSEVIRTNRIIDTMLSPVRKGSLEARSIEVGPILDKAVELIAYQGRLRNVETATKHGEVPLVFASEGDLQQVFLILITNALDSMADSGRLSFETRADEGSVVIDIADSGNGIPEHDLPRIFNAFFTTKADAGGTGLGLSIANRIVSTLGGSLSVAATGPGGTTFRIALPATSDQVSQGPETGLEQTNHAPKGAV